MFLLSGFMLIFWVIFMIIMVLILVGSYLASAIALYKMADNAGYKYPWIAWIPLFNDYLVYVLAKRKFDMLGIFSTNNRGMIALIVLASAYMGAAINAVPVVGSVAYAVLFVAVRVCTWRKYYDLMHTYERDESISMLLSILAVFIPVVGLIILIMNMNETPEYGYHGYYNEDTLAVDPLTETVRKE